jgi:ElaB/YqjD/DUF883 family membrane-anchored ribosome-binding protein
MADDLDRLESDVEAARARLSADLAELRSPSTYSDFTKSIRQTAVDAKNSMVDEVRDRTSSAVEDAIETLKAKAASNPTATLVIGVGLAWQLLRHPPIVPALVGGGLISLLRTPADPTRKSTEEHLEDARENLSAQANEMTSVAGNAARQSGEFAKAKAAEVAEQVRDTAGAAASNIREFAAAKIAEVPDRGKESSIPKTSGEYADYQPQRSMRRPSDSVLLGAAGLAVATAFAVALQRRAGSNGGERASRSERAG